MIITINPMSHYHFSTKNFINCTARQCSPLGRKFMECSTNNPALTLLKKHLVIGQRLKLLISQLFIGHHAVFFRSHEGSTFTEKYRKKFIYQNRTSADLITRYCTFAQSAQPGPIRTRLGIAVIAGYFIVSRFWIGGRNNMLGLGDWMWTHSKTHMVQGYTNWAPGYPINHMISRRPIGPSCAMMQNGQWIDRECTHAAHYVCEL